MLPDSCRILLSGTGWGQNQFQKQRRYEEAVRCCRSLNWENHIGHASHYDVFQRGNKPHLFLFHGPVRSLWGLKTIHRVGEKGICYFPELSRFFFHVQWQFCNFNKTSVCRHQRLSETVWIYSHHFLVFELQQMWKNQVRRSCNFWSNPNVR